MFNSACVTKNVMPPHLLTPSLTYKPFLSAKCCGQEEAFICMCCITLPILFLISFFFFLHHCWTFDFLSPTPVFYWACPSSSGFACSFLCGRFLHCSDKTLSVSSVGLFEFPTFRIAFALTITVPSEKVSLWASHYLFQGGYVMLVFTWTSCR